MRRGLALLVVILGGTVLSATGGAQTPAAASYWPGLGDLMTMTVQPRHTKLALAGREKNWAYAAYELHELQEAFERAARVWPQWRSIPIADMVAPVISGPMSDLSKAIAASDAAGFDKAYGELTGACNACHQGAGRGVIVIRTPDASPFPDQDFRAAKP